jgi:hypothetical protein
VSRTESYEELEVLTAVTMNIAFFSDVAMLTLVYPHAITDFSNSPLPLCETSWHHVSVAYPGIFFGGVQQIQLRTDGREKGDLGAVAPYSGVPLSFQMSETRILIRLL